MRIDSSIIGSMRSERSILNGRGPASPIKLPAIAGRCTMQPLDPGGGSIQRIRHCWPLFADVCETWAEKMEGQ